jgi:predicted kinase
MKLKKYAIITIGISSSGKNKWIKEFTKNNDYFQVINRDTERYNYLVNDLGIDLSNETDLWKNWKPIYESHVSAKIQDKIKLYGNQDENIIISGTNLKSKFRQVLIDTLIQSGYTILFKLFDTSLSDALYRNYMKGNSISEYIIRNQYNVYNESKQELLNLTSVTLLDVQFLEYSNNTSEKAC